MTFSFQMAGTVSRPSNACIEHSIQIGFTVGSFVEYDPSKAVLSDKPARYFCRLPRDQYPNYYIKPAGRYILGTQFTDYEHTNSLYRKIFHYMNEHGLKIDGNAYEEFLIDEIAEKNTDHYMLQIAIKIA